MNTVQVIIRGVDQFSATFQRASKDFASFRAVAASSALGVIGALTAVAASMVAVTQHSINMADEMGKAAQKAGVAVDQFSALAYAGKLADVSMEDLIKASKSWSAAAVAGKSGTGNFIGDILKLAEEFENSADGAHKVARAVEVFGKSGQSMIPLLNAGRDALREQFEEAQRFGQVVGPQFAANAERFNDNMTRMKAILTGVWHQVAEAVLPTFVAWSEALLDLMNNSNLVEITVGALTEIVLRIADVVILATEAWSTFAGLLEGKSFAEIGAELDSFRNRIEEVREKLSQPMPAPKMDEGQLAAAQQRYAELQDDFVKRWLGWNDEFQRARQKTNEEYLESVKKINAEEVLSEQQKGQLIVSEKELLAKKLLKIDEDEAKSRRRLLHENLSMTATVFGQLASVAQAFGKKNFAFFKAFSIAEAIVATISSAVKSYDWAAKWGGPAAGAVAAAIATAAGIARVAQITATNPGQAHAGANYIPEQATYLLSRGERVIAPRQNQDLTRFLSGQQGGQPAELNLYIDGQLFGRLIGDMSRDGRMMIDSRAITQT